MAGAPGFAARRPAAPKSLKCNASQAAPTCRVYHLCATPGKAGGNRLARCRSRCAGIARDSEKQGAPERRDSPGRSKGGEAGRRELAPARNRRSRLGTRSILPGQETGPTDPVRGATASRRIAVLPAPASSQRRRRWCPAVPARGQISRPEPRPSAGSCVPLCGAAIVIRPFRPEICAAIQVPVRVSRMGLG
jgi:hypothetical protein